MKTMSVIGIVWFSFSLFCLIAFFKTNMAASVGWGMLALFYAIPYAIAGLIKSNEQSTNKVSVTQQLVELNELKEKGILSADEFQAKKIDLLTM